MQIFSNCFFMSIRQEQKQLTTVYASTKKVVYLRVHVHDRTHKWQKSKTQSNLDIRKRKKNANRRTEQDNFDH